MELFKQHRVGRKYVGTSGMSRRRPGVELVRIGPGAGSPASVNDCRTREFARRLHGTGVIANCLHPGFVATRFGDQSGGPIAHLLGLAKIFAISPAKGAETIVYLESSPDVATTTGAILLQVPYRPRRRHRHATTDLLCCCGSAARYWPA